jgi:multidrug efflux pump subunit AcrA (membrane-fusion protein)
MFFSLVMAGGMFQACSSSDKEAKVKEEAVAVVTALPSSTEESGVLASGQIEAGQTAVISTRVMGSISRIYVKAGDKVVTKGVYQVKLAAISSIMPEGHSH